MRFHEVTDDSDEVLVDASPCCTGRLTQAGWSNIWKSLVTASASLRGDTVGRAKEVCRAAMMTRPSITRLPSHVCTLDEYSPRRTACAQCSPRFASCNSRASAQPKNVGHERTAKRCPSGRRAPALPAFGNRVQQARRVRSCAPRPHRHPHQDRRLAKGGRLRAHGHSHPGGVCLSLACSVLCQALSFHPPWHTALSCADPRAPLRATHVRARPRTRILRAMPASPLAFHRMCHRTQ